MPMRNSCKRNLGKSVDAMLLCLAVTACVTLTAAEDTNAKNSGELKATWSEYKLALSQLERSDSDSRKALTDFLRTYFYRFDEATISDILGQADPIKGCKMWLIPNCLRFEHESSEEWKYFDEIESEAGCLTINTTPLPELGDHSTEYLAFIKDGDRWKLANWTRFISFDGLQDESPGCWPE